MQFLHTELSYLSVSSRADYCSANPYIPRLFHLPSSQLSIQALSDRMSLYLGLPFKLYAKLTSDKECKSVHSGLYHGVSQTIEIFNRPYFNAINVEAIMAHECSHAFLAFHHISLSDKEENEVLTDIAAIYLGFSQVLYLGYLPIDIGKSTYSIGYISAEQVFFLQNERQRLLHPEPIGHSAPSSPSFWRRLGLRK